MEFKAHQLEDIIYELYKRSVISLPKAYLVKFYDIARKETNKNARFILDILAENLRISKEKEIPICQDTGIPVIFLQIGSRLHIYGDIKRAINLGIERACREGYVRASVCSPLTRKNTMTNTPAVIHFDLIDDETVRVFLLPKGCGSENMSSVKMLPPSVGEQGIIEFVVETVKKAGPNPCPPIFIGVGIGGTMEEAALISKKALIFSEFLEENEPADANQEFASKIHLEVNKLNIGPMGLGGQFTCTGVNVLTKPCHIASLPVAVNIQCHAARCASAIWQNNNWKFDFIKSSEFGGFDSPQMTYPDSIVKINYDTQLDEIKKLKPGTWVLLSGEIITARDQTLLRLFTDNENGKNLNIDFNGAIIYFCGPSPKRDREIIGSCGPTTSYRMTPYIQRLKDMGVKAIIGKGYSPVSDGGIVYLATIGGAGAYLSEKIVSCETIAYEELGPEAIMRLEVRDFPAIVIHSFDGKDFYGN